MLATHENALRIPTGALFEGNQVLAVGADNKLATRTVEIGLKNWNWTEIASGLTPGDTIVTTLDRADIKAGALVGEQKRDTTTGGAKPSAAGGSPPGESPSGSASAATSGGAATESEAGKDDAAAP